jgi:hypothetical protein
MRPQYLGPYIVISCNTGGADILAKLDGTILKNAIGAFQVIPYHPCKVIPLPNIFDNIDITCTELQQCKQLNEEDDKFNAEDWTDSNEYKASAATHTPLFILTDSHFAIAEGPRSYPFFSYPFSPH